VPEILQIVVYGIVLGCIISLGAIGVSLIFGILRFAHFAHGDLMTVGAYFALFGVAVLGLPMPIVFPLAMIACALVAAGIDRILYRPLRRASPIIMLISSVGTALMLRSLVQIFWGPDNKIYQAGIELPISLLGLKIKPTQVTIVLGALALVVLLHLFLHRTKMGKAMRALSDNMDLARISGINTERVIFWTWVIAAMLAAAGGIFLGMDTRLNPIMGWRILLPVFAAAILGGIGSFYGAIVGGLVIGIVQELSTLFLSPAYKPAVAFAIMVVMLIVRPRGIFGGEE
jgi:branched-chain amino acid transport system permease protein/neutral amino acid transport system permease protein